MPDRKAREMGADRSSSAFAIVDFQERLVPHIAGHESILANLVRIARGAEILKVPLLVTEQNPNGLGPTVSELNECFGENKKIEKMTFSCFGEPKFSGRLKGLGVRTLLIGGIEAHICVAQTALDAVREGFSVHVLVDAIGARNPANATAAIDRLKEAGAVISTTEMALFELLGRAGTPEFKEVQKLIK